MAIYVPTEAFTIDPGIGHTGIVEWTKLGYRIASFGTIKGKKSDQTWVQKSLTTVEEIYINLRKNGRPIDNPKVYIEYPKIFDRPGGWRTAATNSITKLGTLVGMIASVFKIYYTNPDIVMLDVNAWKGQLPKEVVERRVRRKLAGLNLFREPVGDEWDAIGMGLSLKGRL